MSIKDESKRLYLVNDRKWFKNFIGSYVKKFVEKQVVPTLEQILNAFFTDSILMDDTLNQYEADNIITNNTEKLSLYDIAKNIQNLCSFNIPDAYESKQHTKKLRIKESDSFNDLWR